MSILKYFWAVAILYFIHPMCCTFCMVWSCVLSFGLAIRYILFQATHKTEIEYRRNTQQGMIIRARWLLSAREEPMFFDLCQLSSIKFYTFVSWFSRFALLKFSSAFAPFSSVPCGGGGEVISTFTIHQMKASDYCPHNLVLRILS